MKEKTGDNMSKIGNFSDSEVKENRCEKNSLMPMKASEADKCKLDVQSDKKRLSDMSNQEKIDYYKSKGYDDLAKNREAICRHNEEQKPNLSHRSAPLNSHNFDKLMAQRAKYDKKLTPEEIQNTKESFSKWNPDLKNTPKDKSDQVTVRHARPGEKVTVMSTLGGEPASGRYVTKDNLDKLTPEQRIDKFALGQNKADTYIPAYLHKQDVIEGKIAPQKKFEGNDNISRGGGGRQIVTDGGFEKGAVAHRKDMYTPSERKILNDMHKKGEL